MIKFNTIYFNCVVNDINNIYYMIDIIIYNIKYSKNLKFNK